MLLFVVARRDASSELVVQSGDTRTRLLHLPGEGIGFPAYSPSGHIVYQRGWLTLTSNGIWAVPFSLSKLTVTGKPFLVAQQGAFPSVTSEGTLVYRSASAIGSQQLVWVDRSGKVEGSIGQPQEVLLRNPALSPDGRLVAVAGTENGNSDIWIHDVIRGTKTRLTSDPADDNFPTWSPFGDQVAFESQRSGVTDIFIQAADGSGAAQPLVAGPLSEGSPAWSRDGENIIYLVNDPKTFHDLWYVPLTGERKPVSFLQTPFAETRPVLSPDGQYVAYQSNESGRYEVYVKPFPKGVGKWPISTQGGIQPRWNGRGDELFYIDTTTDTMMAVKVETRSGFRPGLPKTLFTGEQVRALLFNPANFFLRRYDVTADGQRFVVIQPVGAGATTTMTVVENWVREFEK